MTSNKRFGELLSEGIVSVAKRQRKLVAAAEREIAEALGYAHHTVQRWRRGYLPKDLEQVAFLVRYCVTYGRVNRDWAQSFLTQAHYPHQDVLLRELFPERPLHVKVPHVYHNLPPRYGDFLGRENGMSRVLEGLASRWPLISIEGLGGVGKTTLAIETAHRCLPRPDAILDQSFDAVVWVSAKDRPEQKRWLNDVLDAVAWVLNYPFITQMETTAQKRPEIDQLLRAQRILVIVDNFETIEDPDLITWMQQVPEPSKVLLTSRHAQLRSVWAVHLKGLEEPEALELIRRHARRLEMHALETATEDALLPLVQVTEGNPKAIEVALGYTKSHSLSDVVDHLHAASQTVRGLFDDLFMRAWEALTEDARHVLLVMSFFADLARKSALGAAAGLKGYRLDKALEQLIEMSLLDMSGEPDTAEPRYSIHPLVRAFAEARSKEVSEWKHLARKRWLQHFLEFAQRYAGKDWDDWERLEVATAEFPNLLLACQWALENHLTELASDLFDEINWLLFMRGMLEEDAQACRKIISAAREISDTYTLSRWLEHLAWIHTWKGEFPEANILLGEAIQLAEEIGDVAILQRVIHNSGVFYYRRGEYERAELQLQRSLNLALQREDSREIISNWYYLGCVAFEQLDFERAGEWFNQMKKTAHEIKWARAHAYARNRLADIARIQGDYSLARQLLEEGFPVIQNFRDQRRIAFFHRSFALLNQVEDSPETALFHARQAYDLFHRLGMRQEEAEVGELIEHLEDVTAWEGEQE